MPPSMLKRQDRVSGVNASRKGEIEVARERTPASPPSDILTELRNIRNMLERQNKPFTIQGVSSTPLHFTGFGDLPGIPTDSGKLILDHDEDRIDIIAVNVGSGIGYLKPDDGNITVNNAFPLVPLAAGLPSYVYLARNFSISQRIFGAQVAGGGADIYLWITRIDRFPKSTR